MAQSFAWITRLHKKWRQARKKADRIKNSFDSTSRQLLKISARQRAKLVGSGPIAAIAFKQAWDCQEKGFEYNHRAFLKELRVKKLQLEKMKALSERSSGQIVMFAISEKGYPASGWLFEFWRIPKNGFIPNMSIGKLVFGKKSEFVGLKFGNSSFGSLRYDFDSKKRRYRYIPYCADDFEERFDAEGDGLFIEKREVLGRKEYLAIGDSAINTLYQLLSPQWRHSKEWTESEDSKILYQAYAATLLRLGVQSKWLNAEVYGQCASGFESLAKQAMKKYRRK